MELRSSAGVPIWREEIRLDLTRGTHELRLTDWYYGTSVIRESGLIRAQVDSSIPPNQNVRLVLPERWRLYDSRTVDASTAVFTDREVPDDTELLKRGLPKVNAPTTTPGPPLDRVERHPELRLPLVAGVLCVLLGLGTLLWKRRLAQGAGWSLVLLGLVLAVAELSSASSSHTAGHENDSRLAQYGPIGVRPALQDVGTIPLGGTASAVFALQNDGQVTLELTDIRKSCGCEKVQVSPTSLGAGEVGQAIVTVENKTGVGERVSRISLTFGAGGGAQHRVPLKVRAYNERGAYLQPSVLAVTVAAGRGTRGKTLGQWDLVSDVSKPPTIVGSAVWPPVVRLEFNRSGGEQGIGIRLVSDVDDLPSGFFPGSVNIALSDGRTLEGALLLTAAGRTRVEPSGLFLLGESTSGRTSRELPEFRVLGAKSAQVVQVLPSSAAPRVSLEHTASGRNEVGYRGSVSLPCPSDRVLVVLEVDYEDGLRERTAVQYILTRDSLRAGDSR